MHYFKQVHVEFRFGDQLLTFGVKIFFRELAASQPRQKFKHL